ncbi:MAG: ABC transporter substrate-binding protein [Beijerinckiaceae bacterium]
MNRFRLKQFAVAAAMVASFGSIAPASAQEPLRVRLNADIRSTDPGVNRDGNSDMVVTHLVEGLVAYRQDTSIGPMLAEKVDVSADGLSYTFTLRSGVKFHNGETLTSADVKFVWDRYMKRETNWRCAPEFDGRGVSKITAIETPDARTVVFKIEKPAVLFLASMARVDCGQSGIWHKTSLNADGTWNAPVGTGPYTLAEWRRGQFVELVKFKDYAPRAGAPDGLTGGKGGGPERVRLTVIPDSAAAKAALQSSSIDMIPDVDDADAKELKAKPGIKIVTSPTLGSVGMLIQTNDPVLKDVRIRRALALSLDHQELIKAVAGDGVAYNPSPVPTVSGFHGAAQKQGYKRDLAAAKKLLSEAGYKGETIKMLTNKRFNSMYETAVLVQAMAQEAGIKIDFEVIDWATQLDRYTKGDYAMMTFAFSARYDATLSFDMFSGAKATQPRKVWDNAEMQKLINASGATADPAKRQPLFDTLHKQMIEDVPVIWLYNNDAITATGPRVNAFVPWVTEQPRFWAVTLR